jgi:hypothetical protein
MVSGATATEARVEDPTEAPMQTGSLAPVTDTPDLLPTQVNGALPPVLEPPAVPHLTRSDLQRRKRRQARWVVVPWVLGLATFVLRLLTAARGPTDWDSAQYASAVTHFDVTHGQPQPPGYWLYVESGRALHLVTGLGIINSLVAVAALASAVGVGLTAVAGRDLAGSWVGVAAGAVVAASPFTWYSGSTVSTYSFDLMTASLLIILAWRARPGSWHGVAAAASLGLLCGFRQSGFMAFAILALLAIIGSTRRWSRAGLTVIAGVITAGAWFIPMVLSQPGGFEAWLHATRTETNGAAQISSVLDHAAGVGTNFGTFAAYTALALAPLAVLALLACMVLLARAAISSTTQSDGRTPPRAQQTYQAGPTWRRPWYQSRLAILGASIVPPVLVVTLIQFAKSGYLLTYLPGAVIALLIPVGAVTRRWRDSDRLSPIWVTVASVLVGVIVIAGGQRFISSAAVIPTGWATSSSSLWLEQPRYQAPYPTTYGSIRSADSIDSAIGALAPHVAAAKDVVVFDLVDGGGNIYRNAGWELPEDRVTLVGPNRVLYNQQLGALYYSPPDAINVGPGGSALLVASPAMPGLASLTAQGQAVAVRTDQTIGGYRVWRVLPGASVLGVPVVQTAGPRPLGRGI